MKQGLKEIWQAIDKFMDVWAKIWMYFCVITVTLVLLVIAGIGGTASFSMKGQEAPVIYIHTDGIHLQKNPPAK